MGTFIDQVQKLPKDAASFAFSLGEQISQLVGDLRGKRTDIEQRRVSSGITQLESEVEGIRVQLLTLSQQYREVTGANWEDGTGFCQYAGPGERRSYDIDSVDQVLAGLVSLHGEMEQIAQDTPPTFNIQIGTVTADHLADSPQVTREELQIAILQLSKLQLSTVQEMSVRVMALSEIIRRLGAARSVSPVKESVRVK